MGGRFIFLRYGRVGDLSGHAPALMPVRTRLKLRAALSCSAPVSTEEQQKNRREVQFHLDVLLLIVYETHGLLATPSRSGLLRFRILRPMLTSACATRSRSPGVSSVTFRAQSPNPEGSPIYRNTSSPPRPRWSTRNWQLCLYVANRGRDHCSRPPGTIASCDSKIIFLYASCERHGSHGRSFIAIGRGGRRGFGLARGS